MRKEFILLLLIILFSFVSASYYDDYSDVLLVCNNNSDVSQEICSYFIEQRVPFDFNLTHLVNLSAPLKETVACSDYESIRAQINQTLANTSLINYIVTTKGVPLRACSRSIDSMLVVAFQPETKKYYNKKDFFSHSKYGSYLVTRITGYTADEAKRLIINDTINGTKLGWFLFDRDKNKEDSGYNSWDASMYTAMNIMNQSYDTIYDNTGTFLKHKSNLSGYISWGSNDWGLIGNDSYCTSWANCNSSGWNLSFNPGSIGDTAVSTSARSFNMTTYGQSLIADLIRMNISGVKGYVYEPYLSAVSKPNILFDRYSSGYVLADSFYMASYKRNWMDVVVGDPKTALFKNKVSPAISLNSPPINATISQGDMINISIASTTFFNISVVWYYHNTTLGNDTNISLLSPYQINTTYWLPGENNLTLYCNDTTDVLGQLFLSFNINESIVGEIPTYTKFTGNTTNFARSVDRTNVSGAILESVGSGKIAFNEGVNVSGADLDSYVNFSHNLVEINSAYLPGLNKSANITLEDHPWNNTFTRLVILRDGIECGPTTTPACYNYSVLNDTIVLFSVPSWSYYSIGDLPIASPSSDSPSSESGGSSTNVNQTINQTEVTLNKTTDKEKDIEIPEIKELKESFIFFLLELIKWFFQRLTF